MPNPELTLDPELYQPPHLFWKVEDEPEPLNRITENPLGSLPTDVLLSDVNALKYPTAHFSHLGWAVAVPDTLVYFPGGHLVCAVQLSFTVPRSDLKLLKYPAAHVSHLSEVVEPARLVYLPGGHSVWYAVQE